MLFPSVKEIRKAIRKRKAINSSSNSNAPPAHVATKPASSQPETLSLTTLPEEMLCRIIFDHLPWQSILTLSMVSKFFSSFTQDSFYWRNLGGMNFLSSTESSTMPSAKQLFIQGYKKYFNNVMDLLPPKNKQLFWLVKNGYIEVIKDLTTCLTFDSEKIKAYNNNLINKLIVTPVYTLDDLKRRDQYGLTPLHWAKKNNRQDILDYFYQNWVLAGIDPENSLQVKSQINPDLFYWALLCCQPQETLRALIEQGANVNSFTRDPYSPLCVAASQGYIQGAALLLEERAEINRLFLGGLSPFIEAIKHGQVEMVQWFLDNSQQPRKGFLYGINPLFIAAENGHLELVKIFAQKKALFIRQKDQNACTPLFIAAKNGYLKIVEWLLENGAQEDNVDTIAWDDTTTPILAAVKYGHLEVCKKLLAAKKAQFDPNDLLVIKVFFLAIENDQLAVVEWLLDQGVNVEEQCLGYTPLCVAVKHNRLNIVKLLLKHKANINAKDENGAPLLLIAAKTSSIQMVSFLLQNKADIHSKTPQQEATALHVAAYNGNIKMVELLLENGADVNAVLSDQKTTPLSIAKQRNYMKIIEILEQACSAPRMTR